MSTEKKIAPYGTWESPITIDTVAGDALDFNEVHVNNNGDIYLVYGDPSKSGRSTVYFLGKDDAKIHDFLPEQYNISTKIHEYGGGAVSLFPNMDLLFNDSFTNGVFRSTPEAGVKELIIGDKKVRYADFDTHPKIDGLFLAVEEDHLGKEVVNRIIACDQEGVRTVVEGADFYSHPKFDPSGTHISWMQWNHPDMPWIGTEVFIADWNHGKISNIVKIAGQARKESISQPKWHFDGSLLFCSDQSGYWQLYQYDLGTKSVEYLAIKGFEDAEIGVREVQLGFSTYVPLNNNQLAIAYTKNGSDGLILYDFSKASGAELQLSLLPNSSGSPATAIPLDLVDIQGCAIRRVSDSSFVVLGASLTSPKALYLVTLPSSPENPADAKLLKSSSSSPIPISTFSLGQTISFPRTHGTDQGSLSHAIFVPPHNPSFAAIGGSKPPLIIYIHGGPTSHASPGLSLRAQYFTSRGYAYCFVNHAGSIGYGRKYHQSLNYNWGIKDVEDTVSCIDYLASKGLINPDKVGITGESAGGYTTLNALCTVPDVFAAGCSLYGVGNLKSLAADTHKFESHYLFDLLFPSDTPEEEREKIYKERSPCCNADKIKKPLVLLQGDADKVVPLQQAREMESVVREKGGDVELIVFEGEGHGFARKENIKRALEEEEKLWKRTLLDI